MNIQTGQLMLISCVKYKINAMLSKIQYFVKETILRFIYFAIFHPDLSDVCTVMGKSTVSTHRVSSLQERTLHIICFAKFNDHTTQLFQDMKIEKKNVDLVTE